MTKMQWRVCAMAALLPLSALAKMVPADPTDSAAGAPATSYDSAFKNYQPIAEESVTPDKAWRAANDAVAAKPGEDHMMGMQMGGPMDMGIPREIEGSKSSDRTMVMPDGTTMPMSGHSPRAMATPDRGTMAMDKGMKMPMPRGEIAKPKQKGIDKPRDRGMKMPDGSTMPMGKSMKMPMPRTDTSMPGMDMSHDHDGKGH